ncbi:hypothetical protein SCHPADRAFT_530186 [Schizopora paradoxa]|uniref:Uncharacterized protein n=1 Tax=Schizopora paradoxa TaxID=27342 RepID=A0A0H2RL95_9AGAM|nr:hypothetical protein SCHPADRAFT_530186 [Schizopora paradoxa]
MARFDAARGRLLPRACRQRDRILMFSLALPSSRLYPGGIRDATNVRGPFSQSLHIRITLRTVEQCSGVLAMSIARMFESISVGKSRR